ncbi:MAG TPA: phosphopyruvate hydratase [Candidatus Woesearchaeota archaeon]|nr:phosphopyruvate hydratase [Candidatus Woesearchaeota archaeon]
MIIVQNACIKAREVLDSRGNPTVEAEIILNNHIIRAIVASGASTGKYEALELRDKDKRYNGKGVLKAVKNVSRISNALKGINLTKQKEIDEKIIKLDATKNKTKLGANAMLAASMACLRAGALLKKKPLYQYISEISGRKPSIPIPFCNVINGGKHADNKLKMQEFMIVPIGLKSFSESVMIVSETYHTLKRLVSKKYGMSGVGDEGGFAPRINNAFDALELITKAIKKSGHEKNIRIALDPAASEFYKDGKYVIEKTLTGGEMVDYYAELVKKYPIISIEDPFDQDDFEPYTELTRKIGSKIQIVGDDLLVTNTERIRKAVDLKLCNALLLKPNQIGTVTEAIDAANLAFKSGWNVMVSHRSGETEDSFIADLATGLGCGQIKLGAPCRGERTCKYNQLLRIEEQLGKRAYARWKNR